MKELSQDPYNKTLSKESVKIKMQYFHLNDA